jgi:hypothetical protein
MSQPLREVSPEKLNSPRRSPQRPSPELKITRVQSAHEMAISSAKSEELTKELSEMLAAKRAARQISLPNSEETMPRPLRKRTGLGRASSLGLANNQLELPKATTIPTLHESILLSQKVVYGGDLETEEKRQQLLAEITGGAAPINAAEKEANATKQIKDSSATKRKTPAKNRGRGRKKN